ncbi:MAG: hypothetical protein IPP90_21555 [Gemmatimonadaceae bacterium]|nr:hypothetical protein [Gemmatimonadaceae bacterium]
MQLLLFVFSSSTSLLPCLHGSAPTTTATPLHAGHASPPAAQHGASMHVAEGPVLAIDAPAHHEEPSRSTSDATCPWVVGCVGMVRVDLDAPLRTTEISEPTVTATGVTLRHVTADRDVESPPPRA